MKKRLGMIFLMMFLMALWAGCATMSAKPMEKAPAVERPAPAVTLPAMSTSTEPVEIKPEPAVMASSEPVPTQGVTVIGDTERSALVAGLIKDYLNVEIEVVIDANRGEYVMVTGPGGKQKIHFTPALVTKLVALRDNPQAGQGLMDICPTQARQIHAAIGKPSPVATKSYCPDGSCWPKGPLLGKYTTLSPYEGVRMVWNIKNSKYPKKAISVKIEFQNENLPGWTYGTDWGPTIVFRNFENEDDAKALLDANASRILDYLTKVLALKKGQSGKVGDSCYEITILENGTLLAEKNNSPAGITY